MAGSDAASTSKKMCTKGPEDNKVEKPQLTACQQMRLLMENNDRENKKPVLSYNETIKDAIRENPNAKTLNAITFKANIHTEPQFVNYLLLTATLFNAENTSDDVLPKDGSRSIVLIKHCTKPELFSGQEAQLVTRLNNIVDER
ncbi:hypothetical protein V7S43_002965 [Phytophthora oleae]|uniref:Uncharacterized protein n=1 Tax=Phytophthora oleae TaxID=2107226 RepID=A0ABD3G264_9STRA